MAISFHFSHTFVDLIVSVQSAVVQYFFLDMISFMPYTRQIWKETCQIDVEILCLFVGQIGQKMLSKWTYDFNLSSFCAWRGFLTNRWQGKVWFERCSITNWTSRWSRIEHTCWDACIYERGNGDFLSFFIRFLLNLLKYSLSYFENSKKGVHPPIRGRS